MEWLAGEVLAWRNGLRLRAGGVVSGARVGWDVRYLEPEDSGASSGLARFHGTSLPTPAGELTADEIRSDRPLLVTKHLAANMILAEVEHAEVRGALRLPDATLIFRVPAHELPEAGFACDEDLRSQAPELCCGRDAAFGCELGELRRPPD
jgi:hypothetical protein